MHVSYERYHDFSAPMEGRVATFYCDILGLITIGVGNLCNTLAQAIALPMLLADGSRASAADITADWNKLAADRAYYAARKWSIYSKTMRCHLSEEGIDALVKRTLASNEAIIKRRFPAWDSFPADAQLAIMSVAWAVGAAFWTSKQRGGPGFINLARCIDAQDWEGCVAACEIRTAGNPGVVPRNAKNRFCFHNAQLVKDYALAVDHLCWPDLPRIPSAAVSKASAARDEADAALDAFVLAEAARIEQTSSGQAIREYEEAGLVDEPTGGGSDGNA